MRRTPGLVVAAMALFLAAACAGSAQNDAEINPNIVEEATENTEARYAGTDGKLPQGGPAAQTGKTVWALSCTSQGPGCAMPAEAFAVAGEELGWEVRVIDGKLDPAVYSSQIRAAAAAGADAVVLFGVNCGPIKGSIEAVQRQNVAVYGANALDCDEKYVGSDPLFDAYLPWGPDQVTYESYLTENVGPAIADWVIAQSDGDVEVIHMQEDDNSVTRHIGTSAADRFAQCEGCIVHPVPFTGGDLLEGQLQSKTSAAIRQYPEATVVTVPIDATVTLGVGAAVEQARETGRELLLTAQEGVPSSLDLIREGTQNFAAGRPLPWSGWAAADGLNRHFAGKKQVWPGIGLQVLDTHHPPTTDVYDGNEKSSGYRDNYRRIWGVN